MLIFYKTMVRNKDIVILYFVNARMLKVQLQHLIIVQEKG
jgi:hypothetical protein